MGAVLGIQSHAAHGDEASRVIRTHRTASMATETSYMDNSELRTEDHYLLGYISKGNTNAELRLRDAWNSAVSSFCQTE